MKKLTGAFLLFSLMCFVAVYSSLSLIPTANGGAQAAFSGHSGISGYSGLSQTSSQAADNTELQEGQASAGQTSKIPDKKTLNNFINKFLVGPDGSIFTNLRQYNGSSDTLSESVGLLMENCVLDKNKELFDKETAFLKKNLLNDNYLVRWKTGDPQANCNAVADDLRIAGALLDAYELWGENSYNNLAGFIQNSIYENQVKDYNLCEFYDWKSGKAKEAIPLCYYDLYTIDRMGKFNQGWYKVEDRAVSVVKNGKISNKSPFYYKYYDYKTGKYLLDEEYVKNKGICLTYTLYTAIHMNEVNEDTSALTDWLKSEISKGRLFTWYDPFTMKASGKLESTAVYALAFIYSKTAGEKELGSVIMARMAEFQERDRTSKYLGGFGSSESKDFYSFDNLTAQWAFCLDSR